MADAVAELRTLGVIPAHAHSFLGVGKREMLPISAMRVMAV
jgi:hypothetical protein